MQQHILAIKRGNTHIMSTLTLPTFRELRAAISQPMMGNVEDKTNTGIYELESYEKHFTLLLIADEQPTDKQLVTIYLSAHALTIVEDGDEQ